MDKNNILIDEKHLYHKYSHSALYKDLFKEYKVSDIKKCNVYINGFKYDERKQSWLKNNFYFGLKEYTCFFRIIDNNEVIEYGVRFLKANTSMDGLMESIREKFKYIKNKNTSSISINILILQHTPKNKKLIKELKYEYCQLNNLLIKQEDTLLVRLNNFIFKHTLSIFIGTTFILTLFAINKLNNMGIPVDYISMESLGLVSHITIWGLMLALGLIIFFLGAYIYFLSKQDGKYTCINNSKRALFASKLTVTSFILIYPCFVILDYYFDNFMIQSNITKSYIRTAMQPSIRTVLYEKERTDILLLGKDTKFIYYLPEKTVRGVLKDMNNTICISQDENSSYINSVIELLELNRKDYHKSVANKRLHMTKIENISFVNTLPSFKEAFCDDKNQSIVKQ